MADLHFSIMGKRYKLRYVKHMKDFGQCDEPERKNKEIRIREGQTEREELDTLLHELTHSLAWHQFDESWVTQAANDIGTVLWRLGWRKSSTGDSHRT